MVIPLAFHLNASNQLAVAAQIDGGLPCQGLPHRHIGGVAVGVGGVGGEDEFVGVAHSGAGGVEAVGGFECCGLGAVQHHGQAGVTGDFGRGDVGLGKGDIGHAIGIGVVAKLGPVDEALDVRAHLTQGAHVGAGELEGVGRPLVTGAGEGGGVEDLEGDALAARIRDHYNGPPVSHAGNLVHSW